MMESIMTDEQKRRVVAIAGFLLILWGIPDRAIAQWTTSGSNIYTTNSGANVGIGTQSPASRLDVADAIQAHDAGTPPDNSYNGLLRVTRPAASGQYINLIRSLNFPWSIGTVYNSNTFAIGQGT